MKLSRAPRAALRPFVELVWATDGKGLTATGSGRELVLPTGMMHIVFRLGDAPLRLFEHDRDMVGRSVGCALIGGARAAPYLREISKPAPSVGALLRPGAAALMIGAPATLFSHSHTRLEDLWGDMVISEIREKLSEARSLSGRLDVFEAAIATRLPRLRGIDPLIAYALARFGTCCSVGTVVRDSGYSHRHFTKIFSEAVGLRPKAYCQVLRFGRALDQMAADPDVELADLAAAQGYADQAHFNREFRRFGGLTPAGYRRAAPSTTRHVPL